MPCISDRFQCISGRGFGLKSWSYPEVQRTTMDWFKNVQEHIYRKPMVFCSKTVSSPPRKKRWWPDDNPITCDPFGGIGDLNMSVDSSGSPWFSWDQDGLGGLWMLSSNMLANIWEGILWLTAEEGWQSMTLVQLSDPIWNISCLLLYINNSIKLDCIC